MHILNTEGPLHLLHSKVRMTLRTGALVQHVKGALSNWGSKRYFHSWLPIVLSHLLPICINNVYLSGMSGFKTLILFISMARVVIINFNGPALCCKPNIYTLAVNIMELLTSLQQ